MAPAKKARAKPSAAQQASSQKAPATKASARPPVTDVSVSAATKGKAPAKELTDRQRREARNAESRRLAAEQQEEDEEEEDEEEQSDVDAEGEAEPKDVDSPDEWVKDDEFPFPNSEGTGPSKDDSEDEDDDTRPGGPAVDVIDITHTPPRPRKKRTNVDLSPKNTGSKSRKTKACATPSGASSEAEMASSDGAERYAPSRRSTMPPSSDAEGPASDSPQYQARTRTPRPMHGLNGKVTLSSFSKPHEPELLHALKEYVRFQLLMFAAFPRITTGKKAPYWGPVFQEYIDKDETPVHFKDIWARWLTLPVVLEAACEHVLYTCADLFRILMKAVKNHLALTGVPGAHGQFTQREIASLVAWHYEHRVWHHGDYDVLARRFDPDTAYEVLWVVDCLREFMYDNRGGLDGLSFLHLKSLKHMPIPMLALLLTIMWHFISQWETGSHNPNKPFGDSYHTLYWSILNGIKDLANDVDGWFEQHSHDLYVAAAIQSNKPYMMDDAPATDVNAGVNKDAVKARVAAKVAKKAEEAKKLAERAAKATEAVARNAAASGPSSVNINFPPPVQ